jgi:hypothetical protein
MRSTTVHGCPNCRLKGICPGTVSGLAG